MRNGPIFLTGVYRSGTTLPAQILNAHPQLCVTHDSLNFFRFYLGSYKPVATRYAEIVEEAESRLGKRFSIHVPTARILERLESGTEISLKDIYEAIMVETWCNGRSDLRWGEKTLLEWSNIPLFLQMFRTGQAIHIIRDPRDVLASYRKFTIEPPHRYLDAVFACLHSMNWAATIGTGLLKDRYMVLRHEDVIANPEQCARELCHFLHIEFNPVMLDASHFTDHAGKPWRPNTAFGDVRQGTISSGTTERWRSTLQEFEIVFVESVIGELLEYFGYQGSGVKLGAADLRELWDRFRSTPLLQDRLQLWLSTGQGVESYPSDPTDPKNWARGMGPRGAKVEGGSV